MCHGVAFPLSELYWHILMQRAESADGSRPCPVWGNLGSHGATKMRFLNDIEPAVMGVNSSGRFSTSLNSSPRAVPEDGDV